MAEDDIMNNIVINNVSNVNTSYSSDLSIYQIYALNLNNSTNNNLYSDFDKDVT